MRMSEYILFGNREISLLTFISSFSTMFNCTGRIWKSSRYMGEENFGISELAAMTEFHKFSTKINDN